MQTASESGRLFLCVLLIVALAGWGFVTYRLTSASRAGVETFEKKVRDHPLAHHIVPRQVRAYGASQADWVKHFLAYFPFGLLAGAAGLLGRNRSGRCNHLWVSGFVCSLAAGLAVLDEWRQVALPDRDASWRDLNFGLAGIVAGWGLFLAARWIWKHLRARRAVTELAQGHLA